MAGGLAALLDDVAALAKLAAASADDIAAGSAKASAKAAGVVIDDAAVTPQYVQGIKPKRELPIIWKITKGSLINKLVFILPIALLLSQFAPFLLPPLLMLGGLYLCFEGAEKVWELIKGKEKSKPATVKGEDAENEVVKGAVRTDLILSAEIMVISLNEVADQPFWNRLAILIVVAIGITVLVYGTVGLLVKLDDIGLAMAKDEDGSEAKKRFGMGLVNAMPTVMKIISYIGMVAMIWVGGHIILVCTHDLGLAQPYGFVHHLEEMAAATPGVGGFLGWLVNTALSFVLGLIVGAVVAAIVHVLPFGEHDDEGHDEVEQADAPAHASTAAEGTTTASESTVTPAEGTTTSTGDAPGSATEQPRP